MSGTSGDGIDCVLFDVETNTIKASYYQAFSPQLTKKVLSYNQCASLTLLELSQLEQELTKGYAKAVKTLLKEEHLLASNIRVIGCHGQTLMHDAKRGTSIQLCDGAKLAYLTGIEVVCDFRRADLARSGEGAPFAPLIHNAFFLKENPRLAVVNIGGIANVSLLSEETTLVGFDVGPGNVLIDSWVQEHWQKPYDYNGTLSESGKVVPLLLARLKEDPWFKSSAPKSLDRSSFSLSWVENLYEVAIEKKEDVLKTLVVFSAELIVEAIKRTNKSISNILVCGGGAKNKALMKVLASEFTNVEATDAYGLDADFIEACLFAWLAYQRICKQAYDWSPITGAYSPGIYGAHYLP